MIKIKMAGMEHDRASLEYRELFAFSTHACAEAIKTLKERNHISCILLSTCNRTELWVSYENVSEEDMDHIDSPFQMLCCLKKVSSEKCKDMVVEREGESAVEHLFWLACGMKSKIFGEDQIITQVKNALSLARENQTVDTILEKLFQLAITAAKKVKTQVQLSVRDISVVERVLNVLYEQIRFQKFCDNKENDNKEKQNSLKGSQFLEHIHCLVIGNGEIGRLAASKLLAYGADVTMTLRQYKKGSVIIPDGCAVIPYRERLQELAKYDVIVSGTASPHYTLGYEEVKFILNDGKNRILFDLAVPRDISPELSELSNLTIYNIDSLGSSEADELRKEKIEQAQKILDEYFLEYQQWYYFRDFVSVVDEIGKTAAVEVYKRLQPFVKKLNILEDEKTALEQTANAAVETVVSSMLYGLRERLDRNYWDLCFQALKISMLDSIRK